MIHRTGKWTASSHTPTMAESYGNGVKEGQYNGRGGCGRNYGGHGRGRGHVRGGGSRNSWGNLTCYNCGGQGYISRNCTLVGGGQYGNKDVTASSFPGVDDQALRHPPQSNAPRERTLPYGTVVKWCGECGL